METKDKIILISILILQAVILFIAYQDTEKPQTITIKINNEVVADEYLDSEEEEPQEI